MHFLTQGHFKKKIFIYLVLERGVGKEKEREINKYEMHWLPLTHPQLTWPATQAYVPLLGIEPVTFQFVGKSSVH